MKKIFLILMFISGEGYAKPLENCGETDMKIGETAIYRCSNEEVICYVSKGYNNGGISCFSKQEQNLAKKK